MSSQTTLARLTDFVAEHPGSFRRSDQVRWAALYLLGLLEATGRRNIEALARAILASGHAVAEDIAQGLGHFLSHSPWDEGPLWARLAERRAATEGVFALEELTFVKQGRHSVGVHRQHSRALGRKANCQLAVALYHVADVAVPVGVRLYLPRAWHGAAERIEAAGVPPQFHQPRDRGTIGLELLTAARAAGLQARRVAPGPGWAWTGDGELALRESGFEPAALTPDEAAGLDRTRQRLEELGLDHFEGRLWRGFHHHTCLVALAEAFDRVTA